MDLDNRMTICYSMNKMAGGTLANTNAAKYVDTIYDVVERGMHGMNGENEKNGVNGLNGKA